jgi:ABC-2 type transport system permease protein
MKILLEHLVIQFKIDFRDKGNLMTYYLVPLVFYLVMGAVFSSINPETKDTLSASMTIFAVTMGAVLGMPAPIVRMRESGVLRGLKVSGVPSWSVFLMQAVSTGIHLTLVALIIFFTAPPLFDAVWPQNSLAYLVTLAVLIFASLGIGLLIGVLARSQAMAMMLSQAIFLPTMMLSGIMFPSGLLPQPLRLAGYLFPGTYVMQAFSDGAFHSRIDWQILPALLAAAVIGLLALLFSVVRYRSIARSL